MDFLNRFELQVGKEAINKLNNFHIALFGLGGVGSFCAEILARSGVGQLSVIDKDKIDLTNINRQIFALQSTINQDKVQVCKERLLDINPNIKVNCHQIDFCHQTDALDFKEFDYVIDAIDDVKAKVAVILYCSQKGIPLITSMGTGNRYKIPQFEVEDIFKTSNDGLARKIRSELRKANFKGQVDCVYTKEIPEKTKRLGSVVYYPLMCAGVIVSFITNKIIEK